MSDDRRRPRGRTVVAGLAAATGLVLALDLSGAVDTAPVRQLAAAGLGPLERAVGPRDDETTRLRAENTRLAARLTDTQQRLAAAGRAQALLDAPALGGLPVVTARVVGVGPSGPAGPERVTLDVGARDGVEVDRAVVTPDGLVGRVVTVGPWTCDVLLLGARDVAVGVRVGSRGVLGEVSAAARPGGPAPAPGTLALAPVAGGALAAGDTVTTLGSPGDRPFPAGLVVGTVSAVDDARGRPTAGGVVTPAVASATLDVVGVVLGARRSQPRPAATAGG
ncbi:rod shape-determining protein MreC [Phycicoccus sp. MAQZ13P-2]|uniref:rod shape-determining protein MreC n=1 Tax=Phycicoccus mangrovi TaxID=2840470 RepID=UPI001BFFDEA9|nr:rod shape-determining protein MreC [Phycicoccus mangrovi]MBT9255714.1 rod shape-determining protein MreC [Phycicoccus mangrovi]MBT9274308.1 rod shape-determining protein MreC [Phycicoccus mangrovi]